MAAGGSALEILLLKFGVDMSAVKIAGQQIKQVLADVNAASQIAQAQAKKDIAFQGVEAAKARALATQIIAATRQDSLQQAEKAGVLKLQTLELQKQIVESRVIGAVAAAGVNIEREKLAIIQRQNAVLRQQQAERRGQGANPGFLGSYGSTIATTVFGGGLMGSVATGVVAGAGISALINAAIQGVGRLTDSLKHAVTEASSLAQMQAEYNDLITRAGENADEYLLKLRHASEGLASRFDLTRVATIALKSPLGVTPDKLLRLLHATVGLSDVYSSVPQGLSALQQYMQGGGRGAVGLARATGMTRTELEDSTLERSLGNLTNKAKEFEYVVAKMEVKFKEMADLPLTVEDGMNQLSIATHNVIEQFGVGFTVAPGMQVFLEWVGKLSDKINGTASAAEKLGEWMGNVFGPSAVIVIDHLLAQLDAFKTLVVALLSPLTAIGAMLGVLEHRGEEHGLVTLFRVLHTQLSMFTTLLQVTAQAVSSLFTGLVDSARIFIAMWAGNAADLAAAVVSGTEHVLEQKDAWKQLGIEITKDQVSHEQMLQKMNDFLLGKGKKKVGSNRGEQDENNDYDLEAGTRRLRIEQQLADAKAAVQKAGDEATSKARFLHFANDEAVAKAHYESALGSLSAYLAEERKLTVDNFQQKEDDLRRAHSTEEEAFARQVSFLERERALPTQKQGRIEEINGQIAVLGEKVKEAQIKLDADLVQLQYDKQNAFDAIEEQGIVDREATQKVALESLRRAAKEELDIRRSTLEKSFTRDRAVGPGEYLAQKIELLKQGTLQEIGFATEAFDALGKKSTEATEEHSSKVRSLVSATVDALAKLVDEAGVAYATSLSKLDEEQQAAESKLNFLTSNPELGGSRSGALAEVIGTVEQKRAMLKELLGSDLIARGSADWEKYTDQLLRALEVQYKYSKELQRMRDLMTPLGQAFQTIGRGISSNFTSPFAQDLGSAIQAGAKSIQESSRLRDQLLGTKAVDPALQKLIDETKAVFDAPREGAGKLATSFDSVRESAYAASRALQRVADPTKADFEIEHVEGKLFNLGGLKETNRPKRSIVETVGDWVGKFDAAVTAVTNFTSAITGARSAISGGIGGGLAGAGLGNVLGSGLGAVFKGIGSAGGPVGQLLGAGVGAVVGAITGHKQASARREMEKLQQSFKVIMQDFAKNQNEVQQTILGLQQLVVQARQQMAASKKGGDEFQKLIDQYSEQIIQLQTKQDAILVTLRTQLALATAPAVFDSVLNTMQQIQEKFLQFWGAAKVPQDFVDALGYFNKSIEKYQVSIQNDLLADTTAAVEDALKLDDLLFQRQQMVLQYEQQLQAILSQGALVRSPTRAQLGGRQLQELTTNFNRQKLQLDAEVATTQFKVDAEHKIFSVAYTRIQLENQLVGLQNQQTLLDMQRIVALKQTLQALATGNYNLIPGLTDIFAALPKVNNPNDPNRPASSPLEVAAAEQYSEYASFGYGDYRGANL